MNKETIEKMFDKRFQDLVGIRQGHKQDEQDNVKQFIFEEILPEVIKSALPKKELKPIDSFWSGYQFCAYQIEEKVKELYGIDLTTK